MNRKLGAMLLVLPLCLPGAVAAACDDAPAENSAHGALIGEALSALRAERGRQIQATARATLAQLRSDAQTALAQGASTAAGPSIRTGP